MADTNKDDFWNQKSDDSFWNEPISYENTNWGNDTVKSEQKNIKTENPFQDNPYVQNDYGNCYTAEELNHETFEGNSILADNQRHLSVQAIVRLASIVITVLICIFLFYGGKIYEKVIEKDIKTKSFQEYSDEESFVAKYGNKIIMPQKAYTVLEADSAMGLPVGEKMILVPIETIQGNNKSFDYNYHLNCYVGYDDEVGMIYKAPLIQRNYYPFLLYLDIPKENMLGSGGLSYYYSNKGFFCFFISKDTEEINFIIEEASTKYSVYLTDSIHRVTVEIEETDLNALQELIREDD